jgi:competence ComEA-like helix-hairpin-helix protein
MSVGVLPLRSEAGGAWSAPAEGRLRSPRSLAVFALAVSVLVGAAAGLYPLAGVAVLAVAAVTLVVLQQPVIGGLALAAVVPAASGLRPGLPVPGLRLSEAMIGGIATLILLAAKTGRTPPWRAFDWLALGYLVATAVLGTFDLRSRAAPITFEDASKLFGPLQFFLLYRAALTVLTSAARRRTAVRLILFASVPVSGLALLQQAHVAGVPQLLADVTGSTAYIENTGVPRATGPFPFWHELGSYLFVIVLIGVSLLVADARRTMHPKVLLGIVVLAAVAVINTASFTPIAGMVAGTFALVYMERRSRRLVGSLAVAVGVLAILFAPLLDGRYKEQFATQPPKSIPYLPQNFSFRIEVWRRDYLPLIDQHLTTGYGPGVAPEIQFVYTESVYVTLLLRGGLPLLLVYGGLMLAIGASARSLRYQDDSEQQAVARVLYVLLLLIVFMQLVTNYFVNVGFPHLFWLLAALLYGGAPVGLGATALRGGRRALVRRAADRLKRVTARRGGDRRETARVEPSAPAPRPQGGLPRPEPATRVDGVRATSPESEGPLDLNTATAEQLTRVPGVGPIMAQRIIDWRVEQGGFRSVDELRRVPGIGPIRLAALRPWVHT